MIKIFCDACGAEMPKPGSRKPISDMIVAKFGVDGQLRNEKSTYCEDCTEKIQATVNTLKPAKSILTK